MKLYNQELQKAIDKNYNADREPTGDIEMDIELHHKEIIERELIESLPRSLKVKGKLLLQRLKANNVT